MYTYLQTIAIVDTIHQMFVTIHSDVKINVHFGVQTIIITIIGKYI